MGARSVYRSLIIRSVGNDLNQPWGAFFLSEYIQEIPNLNFYHYFRVTPSRSYLALKCEPFTTMDKQAGCSLLPYCYNLNLKIPLK